jgi:hypothetical protein
MRQVHRPLFRESALREYSQRREQSILPHFVSPAVFVFSWLLIAFLLLVGLLVWTIEVPVYIHAPGVVVRPRQLSSVTGDQAQALVFFPVTSASQLHAGSPIQVHIDSTGKQFLSTIVHVEPGSIAQSEAQKRYALDPATMQMITGPSVAVIVLLGRPLSPGLTAGSKVSTQLQVGTQQALSLFLR